MNIQLQNFYSEVGTDAKGRTFEELLNWTDEQLEECHDQIQWCFPLPEPSKHNLTAPLLGKDDIKVFRQAAYQHQARRALERFRKFYGFDLIDHDVLVADAKVHMFRTWAQSPRDHNYLRITRIIRFLTIIKLHREAAQFFSDADTIAYWSGHIPKETRRFWINALIPDKYREDGNFPPWGKPVAWDHPA